MSTDDGLVENHYYTDLRGLTWEDYDDFVVAEQELLECGIDMESDEFWEFAQNTDNICWVTGLDAGVASSVAALSAIGAVPVSSCSGMAGHYESHPLVVFWAELRHRGPIEEATKRAGIKLFLHPTCAMVYADNIESMPHFAAMLARICR